MVVAKVVSQHEGRGVSTYWCPHPSSVNPLPLPQEGGEGGPRAEEKGGPETATTTIDDLAVRYVLNITKPTHGVHPHVHYQWLMSFSPSFPRRSPVSRYYYC